VYAGGLWVASIIGAGIAVIAVAWFSRLALTAGADVVESAGIAVVAGGGVVGVDTPESDITSVVGAEIVIVAMEGCGGGAGTGFADVTDGTGVVVAAGILVGQV
jgi:hypothetical protein